MLKESFYICENNQPYQNLIDCWCCIFDITCEDVLQPYGQCSLQEVFLLRKYFSEQEYIKTEVAES